MRNSSTKSAQRRAKLELTYSIARTIQVMSGLSAAALNRVFFPASCRGRNPNGLRFQRYLRKWQALSAGEMARLIRRAQAMGWWPTEPSFCLL